MVGKGFHYHIPFLIKMLEVIVYGSSEYEMYNDNWKPDDKKNALAHLKALESFEFVYVLTTLQRSGSLLYVKEAVVKLQGKGEDISCGIVVIQQSCTQLKLLRADVDEYSHRIFEYSCRIAAHSNIAATMPRVIQRQAHHSNPESTSVEEYYERAIVIPFLDHLINEITCRFDTRTKQVASIQGLLPVRITHCLTFRKPLTSIQVICSMLKLLMKKFTFGNPGGYHLPYKKDHKH